MFVYISKVFDYNKMEVIQFAEKDDFVKRE